MDRDLARGSPAPEATGRLTRSADHGSPGRARGGGPVHPGNGGETPLLSLENVSKTFDGAAALRGASLAIAAGEIHALVGENGAGKSTFIRILAGVLRPDRADIRIDGRMVDVHSPNAADLHGLRFIHQELSVVPTLSVAENIFLGRSYPTHFGVLIDWNRLAEDARATLLRLGISHIDPQHKMAQLGLGDQMLVRISSAFVDGGTAPARVYVMDEPTAALTGEEAERLFRVLNEIRTSGRSVLYVSHRLEEIMRLCDRVTVFRDGATVGSGASRRFRRTRSSA